MYGGVHKDADEGELAMQATVAKTFTAFDIVVLTASAGGIAALISFLSALPVCFPAPIVVAQHLAPRKVYSSQLDRVLQRYTKLSVKWADDGELPLPGTVYLVPQDKIATLDARNGSIAMRSKSDNARGTRSGNPLFESAANVFGMRALAIVLSGALSDGAEGAAEIARLGGRFLAQSYDSCEFSDMPRAAMIRSRIGLAFDPPGLAQAVMALVMAPGAADWFQVGAMRSSAVFSYGAI